MTPMAGLKGQCICIKFCFKLCKAVRTTWDEIWVYCYDPEVKQPSSVL